MNAESGTSVLDVISPYSGERIGEVPTVGQEGIEEALASASTLFAARDQWLALHQRVAILNRLADLMDERQEELARQAAAEGGKPLLDSKAEAARAVDGVRIAIESIRSKAGEVIPMDGTAAGAGRIAFTTKEPIGVVVAISAFNHPLNLIVHQVVPAIAAGCPVIVKPAEDTPLSCRSVVSMLHEAGLPPQWCRFVMPRDLALAEALVTDPRVGFFSFIGSAKVGWMLRSKLAAGTRCALEHGGAAPLIVAADADLDQAIPSILKGGFYHAGQVCVSVQRVFAHRSIARGLAERLAEGAQALATGDPLLETTEVGPLIRPKEVDRVAEWVTEAEQAGASRLAGGERLDGNCYAPTVLLDPPDQVRVSREEVFGPVVCVYGYEELDDALARANALPYAFQAAVFTRNLDTALRIYRRIDASAVMVNDHTAFRVDGMPFAGLGASGYGTGGIPHTIADMQVEKMMVLRSGEIA